MGMRWVRGPIPNSSGLNQSTNYYVRSLKGLATMTYYYLRHILGYTLVDEQVQAGSTWVWNHHTKTGSDGVFSGSSLAFTAAGGTFAAGDVNKFLVVVDSTNEENCGIFEIMGYTSATEIAIDFYSDPGVYPTASTGMTYFVVNGDDGGDPRADDYFVLNVNHATSPYTVKLRMLVSESGGHSTNNHHGIGVEVSPESDSWDAVGHAWKTSLVTERLSEGKIRFGYISDNSHPRVFGAGHTDGSNWIMWTHQLSGTGEKQGNGVLIMSPLESPAPDATELVLNWGDRLDGENNAWYRTSLNSEAMMWGSAWSERGGRAEDHWHMGWRNSQRSADHMTLSQGVNARTGERDALPMWFTRDPNNSDNNFGPWGEIDPTFMNIGTVAILGEHVAFDSGQWLHIRQGLCVAWPGFPFA